MPKSVVVETRSAEDRDARLGELENSQVTVTHLTSPMLKNFMIRCGSYFSTNRKDDELKVPKKMRPFSNFYRPVTATDLADYWPLTEAREPRPAVQRYSSDRKALVLAAVANGLETEALGSISGFPTAREHHQLVDTDADFAHALRLTLRLRSSKSGTVFHQRQLSDEAKAETSLRRLLHRVDDFRCQMLECRAARDRQTAEEKQVVETTAPAPTPPARLSTERELTDEERAFVALGALANEYTARKSERVVESRHGPIRAWRVED